MPRLIPSKRARDPYPGTVTVPLVPRIIVRKSFTVEGRFVPKGTCLSPNDPVVAELLSTFPEYFERVR